MAKIRELTPEEQTQHRAWADDLPPNVREVASSYPHDRLCRIRDGSKVAILAYATDGTVTIGISSRFNRVFFERQVFGVPPSELTECDLPGPGEPVGLILPDPVQVEQFLSTFIDAESPLCDDPTCEHCRGRERAAN